MADADLTWTPRCEVARRGAGRSTAAGRRAPNTKADLEPEGLSLPSSHPETKTKEEMKPHVLMAGCVFLRSFLDS